MQPLLSVVIGFKDWHLARLKLAVQAHLRSSLGPKLEVVVVDYGSTDASLARQVIREGVRVVRAEVPGRWSRSRSLNYGVRAAHGNFVITTDADILFLPTTHETVLNEVQKGPIYGLVQCRDLPEVLGESSAPVVQLDFDAMLSASTFRPRYGMGGCACFPKGWAESVRGYDERMEWWGAEDADLSSRAERSGLTLKWVESPAAAIYHIWHEKITTRLRGNREFAAVLGKNQEIARFDKSIVRNPGSWGGEP